MLLDITKGWLSVQYVYLIGNVEFLISENPDLFFENQLVFGIAAVVGHLFPIFTGFRGGKGIATLLGLLIGLNYVAAFCSLFVFVIFFSIFKYVSLASILSSLFYPFFVMFFLVSTNESQNLFAIFK